HPTLQRVPREEFALCHSLRGCCVQDFSTPDTCPRNDGLPPQKPQVLRNSHVTGNSPARTRTRPAPTASAPHSFKSFKDSYLRESMEGRSNRIPARRAAGREKPYPIVAIRFQT